MKRRLFRLCGGRARIVGESLDRGCDRFGELLKTLNQLGAAGAAQAVKQPPGALKRLGELLERISGGNRRRSRLDLDRRALREDMVEVDPANTNTAADADGGELVLVYPLSGVSVMWTAHAKPCWLGRSSMWEFG